MELFCRGDGRFRGKRRTRPRRGLACSWLATCPIMLGFARIRADKPLRPFSSRRTCRPHFRSDLSQVSRFRPSAHPSLDRVVRVVFLLREGSLHPVVSWITASATRLTSHVGASYETI